MTTDLRINASVSVDGRGASAELKKLAGDVGATKQAMVESQTAAGAAAAALKDHSRSAAADAAEITRLREALVAARTEEALATRSHALAATALNAQGRAAQNLGVSAGQTRASMANLGQQVGDVTQQLAMGTSAATIFAQQGGQWAFAMSGLGGTLGRVGTVLSGPFGAALLGTVAILGAVAAASSRASEEQAALAAKKAQVKTAADRVTEAIKAEASAQEAFDALLKRSATTQEDEIIRQGRLAAERLKGAEATRAQTRALLEQEKAKLAGDLARASDPRFATEFGNSAGPAIAARSGRISDINAHLRELDVKAAEDQRRVLGADALIGLQKAAQLTDAAAAATARYKAEEARLIALRQAGKIEQGAYTAALVAAKNELERGTAAARAADQAGRGQARAAKALAAENRDLTEAYNPLLAAQQDYAKALDDIATAESRGIASTAAAADARLAAAAKLRTARLTALGAAPAGAPKLAGIGDVQNTLAFRGSESGLAREMEQVLGPNGLGRELGIEIAGTFSRSAIELSQAIGAGIAGNFGRALQRSTAFAALVERLAPGQGGAVESGFRSTVNGVVKGIGDGLGKLFDKEGKFAEGFGKLLGGAAVGGGVSDVAGALGVNLSRAGSQIGGAIGGLKGVGTALDGVLKGLGQFAPLIGGVLGGIAGKLLAPKNPFADVALTTTASGVSGSIFNQRGEGSGARGNTLASAVQDQLSRLAGALGADVKPGQSLGAIGFSGDQFFFNRTGGDFKAAGNERFGSAEEAVGAAVANALSTGALATSPRVQAALQRYAGNVNQAVAEALKIRDLEQLLEAKGNPFINAFRDFERQARSRVDVAREYGFDLLEIEKLNADQRSALIRDTLQSATGSARALLDEFRFGDRAGGSIRDQLGALGGERDRLAGLVRGGDNGQLDALAGVIRQIDDLQREAFGSTGAAASGRANSAALLQELVDATEARVRAAADQARAAQAEQTATLKSVDGTLEDIFKTSREQLDAMKGILASLQPGAAGGGAYDFGLAGGVAR